MFITYLPTLRRKNKKLLLLSGIIVIVSALTIGCSGDSANTTQPELYFSGAEGSFGVASVGTSRGQIITG